MSESQGWWYDRKKKIYIKIDDHAQAVSECPKKYRIKTLYHPEFTKFEISPEDRRSLIIREVCSNGFIRARLIQGRVSTLGWQFTGEPHKAFEILKRFAKNHGVGDLTEVTFSDFGLGRSITTFWHDFDPKVPPLSTFLDYWKMTHLPNSFSNRTKKDLLAYNGKDIEAILKKKVKNGR